MLRLAALRREQALAQNGSAGQVASLTGASTSGQSSAQPIDTPAPQAPVATPTPEPATPAPDSNPIFAPRVVVDARFVTRVEPVYPDIAREQGDAGTAIVLATVGPEGNVISTEIDQSTGNKQLDSAALIAARASTFAPPEIDGRPATETYRIVYTFDPNQ